MTKAPVASSLPDRYRSAIFDVHDDVMGIEFVGEYSDWLFENRASMTPGGDPDGIKRYNYEHTNVDRLCDSLGPLRAAITERLSEGVKNCGIPDFGLQFIEMHATLYHHGSHFDWHDDAPDYEGVFVPTRRLTFCYYLHTLPKMFAGGQLEFLDGTQVEPESNTLVFFHPLQQHRVRPVECWSASPMHGRWAITGWIHGDAPEGYSRSSLRGPPRSG